LHTSILNKKKKEKKEKLKKIKKKKYQKQAIGTTQLVYLFIYLFWMFFCNCVDNK